MALDVVCLLLVFGLAPAVAAPLGPDDAIRCGSCEAWNAPREPFRVFGNTYYVGTAGLSVVLIATDDGLVLLDGALPQSAGPIAAHVATLGHDVGEVRTILASHAHFDHVGGIAALQLLTDATVAASPLAAATLASGRPSPNDPQVAYGRSMRFAPVASVRPVADGETVVVGGTPITAHHTPGHTPGGTTWTWESCEGDRCLDVVYADSLNPVSAPRYRFTDHPEVVAALRASIATVAALPCDVLLSVHPDGSGLFDRQGSPEGLVDPEACRRYAATAEAKLEERLAGEQAE